MQGMQLYVTVCYCMLVLFSHCDTVYMIESLWYRAYRYYLLDKQLLISLVIRCNFAEIILFRGGYDSPGDSSVAIEFKPNNFVVERNIFMAPRCSIKQLRQMNGMPKK